MTWWFRLAVFLPAMYLVMVTYCAPLDATASGVARLAARKTVKVLVWTVVMVAVMELLFFLFLP